MFGYVDMSSTLRIHTLYTAFSREFRSDYSFSGERHNFWELVIVTKGRLGVTAGSDVMQLRQGQAMLHEPMEFHRLWSEGDSCPEALIISFGADHLPVPASRIFSLSDIRRPVQLLRQIREVFVIEDDLNIVGVKDGCGLQSQSVLKQLEWMLLDMLSQKPELPQPQSRSAKNYTAIVKVLENSIQLSLSVGDIARLCGMSTAKLKQTFSRYAGTGIMNYFNRLKIQAAVTMMKSGMSVQETAAQLGFSNQNYFSTVFRRITGVSPSHCWDIASHGTEPDSGGGFTETAK
jgi:AraC-like DNA-binding protein